MIDPQPALSIAVLIDELRSEDVTIRLSSLDNIELIAKALGPIRARDELLPFVMDMSDDEDEILALIAYKLGTLVELIGGPEFAYYLIRPLEQLATVEEQCIRDKAIESLQQVCKVLPMKSIFDHFLPFLMRLSVSDWYISRVSACILAPSVLARYFNNELHRQLCELTREDTPKVRKSAFSALATCLPALPRELWEGTCATLERCTRDEEDIVRTGSLEAAASLLSNTYTEFTPCAVGLATRIITAAADDPSWRVRSALIDHSEKLSIASADPALFDIVCNSLLKLAQDPDSEVRAAAVAKLTKCLSHTKSSSCAEDVLRCLTNVSRDTADCVRLALATDFCSYTSLLPTEQYINYCLPVVLQLVRDESVAVRMRMLSSLSMLPAFIPPDTLKHAFLPSLRDLLNDKSWRVRQGFLELLHGVAPSLGSMGFVTEMLSWIERLLADTVYCVREKAGITLAAVCRDDKALMEAAVSVIQRVLESSNYLCRVTGLLAANHLALATHDAELLTLIFMGVKNCSSDSVANVRLSFVRTATAFASHDSLLESRLSPIIGDMEKDEDADVRNQCKRYLKSK